jgi:hypothetical protein
MLACVRMRQQQVGVGVVLARGGAHRRNICISLRPHAQTAMKLLGVCSRPLMSVGSFPANASGLSSINLTPIASLMHTRSNTNAVTNNVVELSCAPTDQPTRPRKSKPTQTSTAVTSAHESLGQKVMRTEQTIIDMLHRQQPHLAATVYLTHTSNHKQHQHQHQAVTDANATTEPSLDPQVCNDLLTMCVRNLLWEQASAVAHRMITTGCAFADTHMLECALASMCRSVDTQDVLLQSLGFCVVNDCVDVLPLLDFNKVGSLFYCGAVCVCSLLMYV